MKKEEKVEMIELDKSCAINIFQKSGKILNLEFDGFLELPDSMDDCEDGEFC